ncbi:MAG: succinylglutamate desuccinylase/aspartoacylase family protein [Rubrivivax sp.]|nr:succinylglutamate desuccinylase/aspartoacylase family protein [Rubrivivax sp.]
MHAAQTTHHLQTHSYHGLLPGPRLIVTGAVHGNETCGTRGIERIVGELSRGELEITRGTVSFVPVCNPLAYQKGQRMGDRNLNRRLQPSAQPVQYEDHIANVLCPLLARHDVLLDLHSFRSPGKPFVLCGPADNTGSLEPFAQSAPEMALAAHVGVDRIVEGWMFAYAGGIERRKARAAAGDARAAAAIEDPSYGIGTTEYMRSQGGYAVTLECGQHEDPAAPDVAWHAIRQTLALLKLADLPLQPPRRPFEALKLSTVIDRDDAADAFVKPWTSFDAVAEGELIARRADGSEVRAPQACRIVFPDPNARPGHEWFYLAYPSQRSF